MISKYPSFSLLTVEHKPSIDRFCKIHPPYSDFNFTSMWAWNLKEDTTVSILNGNLVACFRDYSTQEPTMTFLGQSSVNETAEELLSYSVARGIQPVLRWIPDFIINEFDRSIFRVDEDRAQFDYLYKLGDLAQLSGARYRSKRRNVQKFRTENPYAVFRTGPLKDFEDTQKLILAASALSEQMSAQNDFPALKRFLELSVKAYENIQLATLVVEDEIVAFSIDELISDSVVMAHFFRADRTRRGTHDYFNQKLAEQFYSRGHTLWNWQQDLGVEGLVSSKTSYQPTAFLKKHMVAPR